MSAQVSYYIRTLVLGVTAALALSVLALASFGAQPADAQEQPGDAVVAWGTYGRAQSEVPEGLAGVKAIVAGSAHSLAIADNVSPTVTSVLPAENATGIAPGANVSASFSEAMREVSINTRTVKIVKALSTEVIPATLTYDGEVSKKATLDPSAALQRGERYRVVLLTGVKDVAGNRLDQDQDPSNGYQKMVWRFRVMN